MAIEQHLMTLVDRMPAFPKSVQRVLELTRNADVAPKSIVEVIEKDPVLTARVLKVINSAFYSLPSKVAGVAQAVVLLGINTVKNLAIRSAAVGMIPATNSAGFDTDQYLLHSLGCAEVAKLVAQRLGDTDPAEAYIGGLLHDFGKILFTLYMPEPFRAALESCVTENLELYVAERELLGADHMVAGALLAQKWQFPGALVECIRTHHQPPPAKGLGRCLFLANQIVKVRAFGNSGNHMVAALPPGLADRLGSDYEGIAHALPEIDRQLELVRTYSSAWRQA
jgi:putative nucleotidyltransferase with HDIG domain